VGQFSVGVNNDPACAGWYQPHHFRGHMQMWSIEDDKTFGPVHAVDKLASCFAGSAGQVERLHLQPQAVGRKAVGHFGVFKKTSATRIWPLLLQSIEAKVPRLREGQGREPEISTSERY
jgi:hypothetical protein